MPWFAKDRSGVLGLHYFWNPDDTTVVYVLADSGPDRYYIWACKESEKFSEWMNKGE